LRGPFAISPESGPISLESVLKRKFASQKSAVCPSAVVTLGGDFTGVAAIPDLSI
jgi:hypothetical protein